MDVPGPAALGGEAAPVTPAPSRDDLVCANLDWARGVAKRIFMRVRVPALDFGDYVQAATLGLMEAAQRYRPERGVPFQGYALRRVRGEVFDLVRGFLRDPQASDRQASAVRERRDSLSDAADADPLAAMLGIVAGLGLGHLLEAQAMPVEEAGVCAAYGAVAARDRRRALMMALEALPVREARILRLHYLHHVPFQDIAAMEGVTRGRIAQLHRRGLERMRPALAALRPGT